MEYWFITGTGSGLGKAIAEKVLQNNNNKVFGLSRTKTIQHTNYSHHIIDLADADQVLQFNFDSCEDADQIVLINNAGSLGEIKMVEDLDSETIISTYQLNCISPHILIKKFIGEFKHLPCKKIIINITSGAASSPYDGWSIYCATKAALDMMTLCIAKEQELQNNNITLLAIAPGVMDTDMQKQIRETDERDFSRKNKFVELKNNDQLYNVHQVAEKFLTIIHNAFDAKETIQRIVL